MAENDVFKYSVASQDAGMRLDAFVAGRLSNCSRSYAATMIRQGRITVDTLECKPSYRVKVLEQVRVDIPEPQPVDLIAEPMDLDILFEDHWIIVVNKPAGLVVHPAAGHASGTLVNGLMHHCPDLEGIGGERRPGIVHRLDKDTSGAIIVAKTALAHHELSRQFKDRSVRKQYLALVHGIPDKTRGRVELPVGRHPVDRKKMSTVSRSGREALTLWRVKKQFPDTALLEVELMTGRTHQIRVHCQSMGHPLVGDTIYTCGKPLTRLAQKNIAIYQILKQTKRQMLHAEALSIEHPVTHAHLHFKAPLPQDMQGLLDKLAETI